MRVVDEIAHAVGWMAEERMARTSHALEVDGRVWLFDVVDWPGLDERVQELGEPAGVVQLLDRHNRDCAAVARRLGVPHHVVPRALAGTPFELRPVVQLRWWREVALWWPERRLLLVADAVGTIPFFRAGAEPAGLHPVLRLRPPRSLRGLEPDHLLVGPRRGDPSPSGRARERAADGRRRIPRWLLGLPRVVRAGLLAGAGEQARADEAAAAPSGPRRGPAGSAARRAAERRTRRRAALPERPP